MIERVRYRAIQTARYVRPGIASEADAALQTLLPEKQWDLLAGMSPGDRKHALQVHRELVRQGWTDADLLTAALLHDCGKVDKRARVTIVHRVLKVLLRRFAPHRLEQLSSCQGGWLRHGLFLSLHHGAIGAMMARNAGASERTCWFIQHHDDGRIFADTALAALQDADARE